MPFPRKLLNSYEEITVDLHPHWIYFGEPVLALVGSIVLAILVLSFTDGTIQKGLAFITVALIVVTAGWTIVRYLKWTSTNFVITTHRLIFRQGIFAKHGVEIPLERVMNVNFNQSILERIVGAGDLLIESGGRDGQQRFSDIRKPEEVQNLIHAQVEANSMRHEQPAAMPPPPPPPVNVDVAGQLEKLEGLRSRGTITPEEFEAQKLTACASSVSYRRSPRRSSRGA
jgi:membrane protein YdbS with pleckstrin-like domain